MALQIRLDVSSTDIDFGNVAIGQQVKRRLVLTLQGADSTRQLTVQFGALPAGFSFVGFGGTAYLSVNNPFTVAIVFTPSAAQSYSGTFDLTYTNPANGTVYPPSPIAISLSGTGISGAILNLSSTSLNFGVDQVNNPVTQTFRISNSYQAGVNLAVSLAQPADGAFTILQRSMLIGDDTVFTSDWVGATVGTLGAITAIQANGTQVEIGGTWLQVPDLTGQTATQGIGTWISSIVIAPGDGYDITIQFSPSDTTMHLSELDITHNDASKTSPLPIMLSGTGTNIFTFESNNYALLDGSLVRLTLDIGYNGVMAGYNSSLESLGVSIGNVGENELFRFDMNQLISFPGALEFTLLDDLNFLSNLIFHDSATQVDRIHVTYERSTDGGTTWATEHEGCASIDTIQFDPRLSAHEMKFTSTVFTDVLASYQIADIFNPPGTGRVRTIGSTRYGTNVGVAGIMKNFTINRITLDWQQGVIDFLNKVFSMIAQITLGEATASFTFSVDYDYTFKDTGGATHALTDLCWGQEIGTNQYINEMWGGWLENGNITVQEAVRRICQTFGIIIRVTSAQTGEIRRALKVPDTPSNWSDNLSEDDIQQFKLMYVNWVLTWDDSSEHRCINGVVIGGPSHGMSDANWNKILQWNSNALNQPTDTLGIRECWDAYLGSPNAVHLYIAGGNTPMVSTTMPDGNWHDLISAVSLFWMTVRGDPSYSRGDMPKLLGLDYGTDGFTVDGHWNYFVTRMVKNYKECTTKFEAIPIPLNAPQEPPPLKFNPPKITNAAAFSQPGIDAPKTQSVNSRGAWDETQHYDVNDQVPYNGGVYACISPVGPEEQYAFTAENAGDQGAQCDSYGGGYGGGYADPMIGFSVVGESSINVNNLYSGGGFSLLGLFICGQGGAPSWSVSGGWINPISFDQDGVYYIIMAWQGGGGYFYYSNAIKVTKGYTTVYPGSPDVDTTRWQLVVQGRQLMQGIAWFTSAGPPGTVSGSQTNDCCIDTNAKDVYQLQNGIWMKIGSINQSSGGGGMDEALAIMGGM